MSMRVLVYKEDKNEECIGYKEDKYEERVGYKEDKYEEGAVVSGRLEYEYKCAEI